jgi:hypothetical protein
MNGSASALQQLAAGLQRKHELHADGIAQQSRQEMEKLAEEIRAEHESNRISRELQSTLIDTMHADRRRMEAAIAQAAAGIQAAAAEMIRENRKAFARMAAQQGLTAAWPRPWSAPSPTRSRR